MLRYFIYLLLLTSLGYAGCNREGKADTPENPPPAELSPKRVVAIGRIEPENKITTLSTDVSGIVTRIRFDAGDSVKAGDVIVELNQEVEAAQLALAKSRLQTQQQEIALAEANLQSAEISAQNAKVKFERTQNVFQQEAETGQNVDDRRTEYETAQKEVARLQASRSSARSRYAELQEDIKVSQAQVGKRSITALADGVLLTMDVTEGAMVSPGTAVAEFAPNGAVTAICEVDELFAGRVKVGQQAGIREQGTEKVLAQGEVIYAAPSLKKKSLFADDAGNLEDRRVREVRIRLRDPKNLLYNSRVECVIDL